MISTENNTPLKILLADDDPDDRYLFDKALKLIPVATHLITVNNGEELMDYLLKNAMNLPDVLFLDLSMPRKTGFECLIEIKENLLLKNLPVIMITTSFTRGNELELNLTNTLSNMGAQDYIRKPSGFEPLKLILHQAIIKVMEKAHIKGSKNDL